MRISDWSSYVCSSVLSRTRRDGSAPGLELPGPSQNRYRSLLTKKFSGKRWPGHLINHYSHRPMFVPPPENDPDQRCPWTLSTSHDGRSLTCHRPGMIEHDRQQQGRGSEKRSGGKEGYSTGR